jgi:hypothetical protein
MREEGGNCHSEVFRNPIPDSHQSNGDTARMAKAIHEVATEILAENKRPMTVDEIYDIIAAQNLYTFKSACPRSVLRNQLRRHCKNVESPNQAKDLKFYLLCDGRFALT